MARVKSAKDRITAFMKAKGWDAADIKDAFDELDAADADMGQLADALGKNEQWNTWYQTAAPEIQKIAAERDSYKSKLDKLQGAGFSFEQAEAITQGAPNTQGQPAQSSVTQDALKEFQSNLTKASSDVMKALVKVNFRHFKEFGTEADTDALEKLMQPDPQTGSRKAYTIDDAYRIWSEPEYEKKRAEDTQKKIDEGVKAGVQAELSKQNVPGARRRKTQAETLGVENAPLDKPAPADRDLRQAFMADLDSEVTH